MALFDRFRRQTVDSLTPEQGAGYDLRERRASLRVLRADGQRVDLTAQDAGTRLALVRQEWQTDAWTYRDMIGELRYAQRLLARSVSTVRFYAAALPDDPTETPKDLAGSDHGLDAALAADAVANLARLPLDDGPDGFIATFVENLETAGECWIHGEPDDGDGERWTVRSVSEIVGAGDQIMLLELPTISTVGQRPIDPRTEELLRCWTRHPRWGKLADSPLRAMLDVLEEVVLTGREMRAAARSRIASNGVLMVPNSLQLLRTRDEAEDPNAQEGLADTDFMRDFTEALTAPIRNEGDPGAVVPLILRGEAEALKEVRHLTLTRADAAALIDRLQGSILRMLQGLDIQPEQVTGIGATNHWCVDDATEVMSDRGWTSQSALSIGDRVLTLNHNTGLSEWQAVRDIYRAQVTDEPMVLMDGRLHSSLTTPNHRWPTIRTRQIDHTHFIGREFVLTKHLNSAHSITTGAVAADQPTEPKYTDDLVELVGWLWTEGNVRGSALSLAQSHTKNNDRVGRIRAALTRVYGPGVTSMVGIGRPAWRESIQPNANSHGGPVTIFNLNVAASAPLLTVAPGKRVTSEFVRTLTPAQLELFIQVSCMGDGWHYRQGVLDVWQRDPASLDAYELALILSGRSVSTTTASGGYCVSPWKKSLINPIKAAQEVTAGRARSGMSIQGKVYTGTIWCPVTPNGTWLARRRGTVYYTGNSGWQIEASNVRHQVLPTCGVTAGCFTKAFLRPALLALGYSAEQVRRVVVWYDPSPLVESPDRSQDARDAWDRDAISNAALREALRFSEETAPEPHEHLVRLLSRGRLTPQAVPLVAALSGVKLNDPDLQAALAIAVGLTTPPPHPGTPVQAQATRALPPGHQSTANPAAPGQVVPEQTAPTPPAPTGPAGPAPVTAAGTPLDGWRVDVTTSRQLAEVDAALLDRILTAGDAAITRAVERAGGRVRNAARKTPALAASIDGVDATLIAATLGRDTVESFATVTDLLAGAYTRLRDQFGTWLDQSAHAAAGLIVKLAGLGPSTAAGREMRDAVITRYAVHKDAAWTALSGALDAATERALFRTDPLTPEPGRGETSGTLMAPREVTRALVIAGGGTPGNPGETGFGTGPVATKALTERGGVVLGWEWQYRPQVPRGSHFLPHQLLDGARFGTWTDPRLDTDAGSRWVGSYFHPQDHDGCLCASTPVIAFPTDDPGDIVGQRIRETRDSQRGRTATRVAADDAAAGRVGTSIQNEVETRDRILAGVEALRAHYIEGVTVG